MSIPKFTSGDWELVELPKQDDWTGTRFVIRQRIAAPGGIAWIGGLIGTATAEERANAELLLAAPRLFFHLRLVLDAIYSKKFEVQTVMDAKKFIQQLEAEILTEEVTPQ